MKVVDSVLTGSFWDSNLIKIVRFEKLIPNRGARMGAIAPKLLTRNFPGTEILLRLCDLKIDTKSWRPYGHHSTNPVKYNLEN